MKNQKKYLITNLALLLIGPTSAFAAATWDPSFPPFPALGNFENISAITFFKKLYVAVNGSNGSGLFGPIYIGWTDRLGTWCQTAA